MILLGGASVLTELSLHWQCEDPIRFAIFATLAFATGFWRFRIPGMEGSLSASFLFVMIAMVQLSGVETLAIGALGAIGQFFAGTKTRGFDRILEATFQLSGSVIAALASAGVDFFNATGATANNPITLTYAQALLTPSSDLKALFAVKANSSDPYSRRMTRVPRGVVKISWIDCRICAMVSRLRPVSRLIIAAAPWRRHPFARRHGRGFAD